MRSRVSRLLAVIFLLIPFLSIPFLLISMPLNASDMPPALRGQIDAVAQSTLAQTGVPSASIAVVQDGTITYLQAYGDASVDPHKNAARDMRYSVGSISKQFTAAAVLLLAEDGKLLLDDAISRFVPNLMRGNEVTIRQLLSHTSGYQDYWPQDYVMPIMMKPVTADEILDLWARKPLDFDPGTQWQYSNTNFVIAGLIVEKASGKPLLQFLSERVFAPLGMKSVINIDQERLTETDATGYMRYGTGPLRAAPKEGKGWLFAAGELAMSAEDLAKWDIGMIKQSLLKPASYAAMERETVLKNGLGTGYGLGVGVRTELGERAIEHGGEVSGFTSQNLIFPDKKIAVVVLTNEDAVSASGDLARKIAELLFRDPDAAREEEQSRAVFADLQHGKINRSMLTENCNSYFTDLALKDFADALGPLGLPIEFTQVTKSERGGMTFRLFEVHFPQKALEVWERIMPDGKIEQYQVVAK